MYVYDLWMETQRSPQTTEVRTHHTPQWEISYATRHVWTTKPSLCPPKHTHSSNQVIGSKLNECESSLRRKDVWMCVLC